ncbi:hypothetical protein PaG_01286 [Moesziomyces aphidis]|uniref:Uncharacterized protein n=1 Tax=Moesziomyces aphidis TaxID=84754 RepID=W3VUF8_MOEAP|nr:hypothetical protein PaG_01286 [Moesziomyces aphidis]
MVVLPPPTFLGAMSSAPHLLEVFATGVYVVTSIIVASYASSAISRPGVRGYAEAWRVGAITFCLRSGRFTLTRITTGASRCSGRSSASSERRAPSLCRFDRLKSDINEKPMTSNLLDAVDYVVPQTGLFGETNVEADDEVVVVVRQAEER